MTRLLTTFSNEEMRQLKKMVASPYFNQRPEATQLLLYLEKYLKTGQALPDREVIYAAIFPDKAFNDHRLRMAMSFLYQLCCQFLAVEGLMRDEMAYKRRVATEFRFRRLDQQFEQFFDEVEKVHVAQPWRNADFFETAYQQSVEKYRFAVDSQSGGELQLQQLNDQFDLSVVVRKLWQACFMLSHQAVVKIEYDYGLLPSILAQLEHRSDWMAVPAVRMYYHCYRALSLPDGQLNAEIAQCRAVVEKTWLLSITSI
jgi:hypothetical protein